MLTISTTRLQYYQVPTIESLASNLTKKIIQTGHTNDVDRRLNDHNRGKMSSTRHHRPLKLIYTEEFSNRSDAMIREKFLKTGKGREVKKELIKQYENK